MIHLGRHLPRRTVLRGVGATLALPLLDSMVPALAPLRLTAAQAVRRLGAVYVPNGMNMWQWTPKEEGAAFELTPILASLKPFRDQLLVLSGLANNEADSRPDEGNGDHGRALAAFLTGSHGKKTLGPDVEAGVSMDQLVAAEFGKETQLASLELALDANKLIGACEVGLACAYSGTMAWRSPTLPLPMEADPRAVFERLFGASGSSDARSRLARIRTQRSLLDSVRADLASLHKRLGPGDLSKLDEYLESVRDIERRIQKAEEQSDRELPLVSQPPGTPSSFEEYAALMFDLLVIAYQVDLARVGTFLMGREQSGRTYPEIGVPDPHHPLSHHGNRPADVERLAKVNAFHVSLFAKFLQKLRATPDGDGSLLDHTVLIYGAGMSNSDLHLHQDLPILVLGSGAQLRGGRHVRFPDRTPMANLHVTLLDRLGVHVDRFGDSSGSLNLLAAI
jgi:hypothetical protein